MEAMQPKKKMGEKKQSLVNTALAGGSRARQNVPMGDAAAPALDDGPPEEEAHAVRVSGL